MRSFTALTLLLALISVLQANAGGASRQCNLTQKKGSPKGGRNMKDDNNMGGCNNVVGGGKNGKSMTIGVDGSGGKNGKNRNMNGKSAEGCNNNNGGVFSAPVNLVTPIHNAVNDKQVSKPAASFIAASMIWFAA